MAVSIVSPPPAEPVTLAEAKAHFRLYHDLEDATVVGFIAAAREAIEARTNRAFVTRTVREVRRIPCDGVLRLSLAPVASLGSVEVDGQVVEDPAALPAEGTSRFRLGSPGATAVVTYSAGYGDGPEAVPALARVAILILANHFYENRADSPGVPKVVESLCNSLSWGGELPPP